MKNYELQNSDSKNLIRRYNNDSNTCQNRHSKTQQW